MSAKKTKIQVMMQLAVGGPVERAIFEFDGAKGQLIAELRSKWVELAVARVMMSSLVEKPLTDETGAVIWSIANSKTVFNAEVFKAIDWLPDRVTAAMITPHGIDPSRTEPAGDQPEPANAS